jgi:hypothetical protein
VVVTSVCADSFTLRASGSEVAAHLRDLREQVRSVACAALDHLLRDSASVLGTTADVGAVRAV